MPDIVDGDMMLETERLRLEPLTPHHARQLFPVLADAHIYTYIPEDPVPDPDALARRYQQLATRRSPSGTELWLNWAVHRTQEHDYIGTLQATVTADQHATIAYLLNPAFWGYGYAQEACRRLLTLLFGGYHIQEVQADVDTRNHASWTLLERLGFRRSAVRHAADYFKGSSSDEYTYALTDRGWADYRSREYLA
jgi:ribosomal-protein-alanine N-acetyltransferase